MKTKKLFVLIFIFTCAWCYTHAQLNISFSMSSHNGYNISCFGGTDGWITANVTGGTPPYTYLWSNSSTTQTISGLPASYYAVTVTDSTNATATSGKNLTQPAKITVALTSSLIF